MATHSFPALGFDPAPGDPDAIEAVARDCRRCAADLSADAEQLKRLTAHLDWQGAGADIFASHPHELHDDLARASEAYGGAGRALDGYVSALRQAKLDAGRLEAEAAEAKARAERHGRDTEQTSQAIDAASPATNTSDLVLQRDASHRLQGHAEDDYQATVTRARAVQQRHEKAGDGAAARIRAVSDAPYHEPGLLSRMAGGAADWVSTHADGLRAISNTLKVVSAVAGALSFIPILSPIFAPVAGVTAVGALAIDAALVATGHGDWKGLAVDAVLMALPVAGRLGARALATANKAAALAPEGSELVEVGAHTVDDSRSLVLSVADSWARPATLARHFVDHGADFGASSAAEYARRASLFLQRSQAVRLATKIDGKGVIRTYDHITNEFGSFRATGATRTYFAPDPARHGFPTNWDYWLAQPGVEPWSP